MSDPASGFFEGAPRLHYLEWNPRGRRTLVCLHGNSANAWWWQPMTEALSDSDFRILARTSELLLRRVLEIAPYPR